MLQVTGYYRYYPYALLNIALKLSPYILLTNVTGYWCPCAYSKVMFVLKFDRVDARRRWRPVCSSYIPTSAYSEAGAFPASAQVPARGHVKNNGQCGNILCPACLVYIHLQVRHHVK